MKLRPSLTLPLLLLSASCSKSPDPCTTADCINLFPDAAIIIDNEDAAASASHDDAALAADNDDAASAGDHDAASAGNDDATPVEYPDATIAMTACEQLNTRCTSLNVTEAAACQQITADFVAGRNAETYCQGWLDSFSNIESEPEARDPSCALAANGAACGVNSECCSNLCHTGIGQCTCGVGGNAADSLTWTDCERERDCCEGLVCRVRAGTSSNRAARYCSPPA